MNFGTHRVNFGPQNRGYHASKALFHEYRQRTNERGESDAGLHRRTSSDNR